MLIAVVILSVLLAVCIAVIAYLLATRPSPSTAARKEEEFRNLATEIFTLSSRQMRDENERRLGEILTPLRENFDEFKRTFRESYDREARERFSLQKHIADLITHSDAVRREARDLTNALKGNNRVQGQWGEMILQSILQRSGLREDKEYKLQFTVSNDEGDRLRPDAVISFPDDRKIIIDSKASLKSYLEMAETDEPSRLKLLMKLHVSSLRNHINELSKKSYQDYIGTARAEFVLMFIPNEGAYLAAMQADDTIWQYAYDNRVIIVSPTHLMSVIKLVEQAWRRDKQDKNALEIAIEGGRLIDKLCTFIAEMDKLNSMIGNVQKTFDSAMAKLNGRGGIVSRAEKLKDLGARSSRSLPKLDDEPTEPEQDPELKQEI